MKFSQKKKYFQYNLSSIIMHEGNSMSSGHYYCDMLYFNTVKYWCCDEDTITQVTGSPDNVQSDSLYQKFKKK